MRKILLDAGHGGHDPGAISFDGVDQEKDFNLSIVLMLGSLWSSKFPEWEIIYTRESDMFLTPGARKRLIEKIHPDVFVSIHCNASSNIGANGIETIHRDPPDEPLATAVQNALLKEFPEARDRGVKTDVGDLRRALSVLSVPAVPSILVECGFITNSKDIEMLRQYDKIASAIVNGVATWAGL